MSFYKRYARGFDAIAGDMGTGGAPTVFDDYGPSPAQLAAVKADRAKKAAAAVNQGQIKSGFSSLLPGGSTSSPAAAAAAGASAGLVGKPPQSAPAGIGPQVPQVPPGDGQAKWWMQEKAGLPVWGWIFGSVSVVAIVSGVVFAVRD